MGCPLPSLCLWFVITSIQLKFWLESIFIRSVSFSETSVYLPSESLAWCFNRYVVDWIFKYFVDKFHLWRVNVYVCFCCSLVWPTSGRQFPVELRTIITASKWWMSWFTTFSWFELKCTIKQSYSWWCKQWWKWFCAHHIWTGGGHHHYSIHLTYPNKAGAWQRHRWTFTEK